MLAGVRRQLEEAQQLFAEIATLAAEGQYDPAYRLALRARNLVFHAARGLAAARTETMPETPIVGIPGGGLQDLEPVRAGIAAALAVSDDLTMPAELMQMYPSLARFLGWLRDEVGRLMRAGLLKPPDST
jgi:hypothetical protein